jgi:subtilisin family serine protease
MTIRNGKTHTLQFWLAVVGVTLGLGLLPARTAQAEYEGSESVLVRIQPGVDILAVAADYGTTVANHAPGTALYSLNVPPGMSEETFEAALALDPRVVFSETEAAFANPEMGGTQIHFAFDRSKRPGKFFRQSAYRQINVGKANTVSTGAGVTVAVLDTGVALDHPVLQGRLAPGYNALRPRAAPSDVPDGRFNGSVGHGTMIAGLIARLAPDAKIMPVRVLNGDGVGTTLSVVAGIHYAVTHGAQVINLSACATQPSEALRDALDEAENADVVVVASAGNDGTNLPRYPAAFEKVLSVTAVEADSTKSAYANYGKSIRVVAPGTSIRSTFWTGEYANWSGTSFAAPFVTIEAALIRARNPRFEASAVTERIRKTAHSVDGANPAYKGQLGAGMIDIERAVLQSQGDEEGD